MKLSKKFLACICALIMATSSLAAYSVSADTEDGQTSASYKADSSQEKADTSKEKADTSDSKTTTVKVGKVTAVNGSRLTVALGEYSAKKSAAEKPSEDESSDTANAPRRTRKCKTRKSAAQTDTNTQSETQPNTEKTADTNSAAAGETPDSSTRAPAEKTKGKRMSKRGRRGARRVEFTENGTTETVTVTSDVTVTKNGKTVSLTDISAEDIVKLKYDENNKLVEIKVSAKRGSRKPAEKKATAESTADGSNSTAETTQA